MRPLLLSLLALGVAGCTSQPFTVDVPLRVVSVSPSGGSVGASRHAPVLATFSEDLDPATVSGASIYLDTVEGVPVEAAVAYRAEGGAYLATLTPAAPLSYSTRYRLTLTSALKRLRDLSPLSVKVTSEFKTEDPPPLAVVSVSPSAGATGVARDAGISITFSEPVRCSSLAAGARVVEVFDTHPHTAQPEATIPGTWTCREPSGADALEGPAHCLDEPALCTVSFEPEGTTRFGWSSVIRVTLLGSPSPDAVRSLRATEDGGSLPQTAGWEFRVEDPPALLVLATAPGAAGGDLRLAPATLLRGQAIVVTLSEPVDCATVDDATVAVTEDADPTDADPAEPIPVVVAECDQKPAGTATDTLTLSRADLGDFAHSAVVTVRLAGGAFGQDDPGAWPKDALESAIATTHGGQLAADLSLAFVVEDPPPLFVLYTEPGSGSRGAPVDAQVRVVFSQPVRIATLGANTGLSTTAMDLTSVESFDRALRTRAKLAAAALPHCYVTCPDDDGDGASDLLRPGKPEFGSACTCKPRTATDAFVFELSSQVAGVVTPQVRGALSTWRSAGLAAPYEFAFRVEDPKPLLVANTWPGHQDVNVPAQVWCDAQNRCATAPPVGQTAAQRATGIAVRFDRPFDCGSALGVTSAGPNLVKVEDLTANALVTGTVQCLDDQGAARPAAAVELLFVPDAQFAFDHEIRFALARADVAADAASTASNTGLRSADWTDWAVDSAGTLVRPLVVQFTVAKRPLEVVAAVPANGAQDASPNGPIQLTFNQPVACDPSHLELGTGITLQREGAAAPVPIVFDCATGWDPATYTATYEVQDPAATKTRLVPGATYTLRVLRGGHPNGPHDPAEDSFLLADFVMAFRVSTVGLRAWEIPADGATGVGPDQTVCAVFTETLTNPSPDGVLAVRFVDCTGRTVTVQGDAQFWSFPDNSQPQQGAPTSDPKTVPGNAVCVVPELAAYGCFDSPQLLPYATDFTASVSGAAAANLAATSYAWTFRTKEPPQIVEASYSNEVLSGAAAEPLRPVSGTPRDVPVNSQFSIAFARPLDKATVTGGHATLVDRTTPKTWSVCPAGAATGCLAATYADADATLILTPSVNGAPALLPYAHELDLVLKGGALGTGLAIVGEGGTTPTTQRAESLATDVRWRFATSPATTAAFNPPAGSTIYVTEQYPIIFSRRLRLSTANSQNIFGRNLTAGGVVIPGTVALSALDPYTATLIMTPTIPDSGSTALLVTAGVQDFRGNPLPVLSPADATDPTAALRASYTNSSLSGSNANGPENFACTSLAPATTCTTGAVTPVRGDQVFTLTMGSQPNVRNKDRMLPSPFRSALSLAAVAGGTPPGSVTCPATNTVVPLEQRYSRITGAGTPVATTDALDLWPDGATLLAGCRYNLTLLPAQTANIFGLAPSTTTPIVFQYVGETTPPALFNASAIAGRDATGAPVALNGATTVAGDSPIVFTFNENVRFDPLAAAPLMTVTDTTASATVTGTLTLGPSASPACTSCVATFVPAAYAATAGILQHGHSFTIATPKLVDMAGNALGALAAGFQVESAAPSVISATVVADAPIVGQRTIALLFSETVDPASVVADTFDADGSLKAAGTVRLADASGKAIAGCVSVDATDARKVAFVTTDSFGIPAGSYSITVATSGPPGRTAAGVTDAAGNPLATAFTQAVALP